MLIFLRPMLEFHMDCFMGFCVAPKCLHDSDIGKRIVHEVVFIGETARICEVLDPEVQ